MEQKSFSDRKVCIVGAGISGLAATRYLLEAGFNPVVFEMKGGVGGVWRQTFQSTKLQTPRLAYQFSDFPWPSDVTAENPTHSQVLDYLESYAKQFGLLDCIQFNTRVVKVESAHQPDASAMHSAGLWGRDGGPFGDDSVWKVGVQKLSNLSGESEDEIEWHFFDFVILCVGKYGDLARIPAFPPNGGPEVFKGTVMHSMDYAAFDKDAAYGLVSGKRVVIIGEHKSARDLAAECAEANPDGPPCKMVFQRAHWALASFSIWGVPLPCLYDSRLAQFILGIPAKGVFHQTLWKLFTPLRWAVSKFVELHVRSTQPLSKYGLVPEQSFLEDVSTCQIHILPDRFFEKADKNLIQFFKCKSWDFISKGVRLDNGTELEADIVIMGTGFDVHKKLSLLSQQFANIIEKSPDCIPLYRCPSPLLFNKPKCISK
eukprot:TRINITY_DN20174_c0_g1_i7.p1 TRINITY_DN20174_c0_g1~~TRINITY_DN20174_c0_g1_i7.p1  ORF type:complete len:429 (-),score=69.31 TRINITY_DN20174_c0_g1_i7:505-1791(-)